MTDLRTFAHEVLASLLRQGESREAGLRERAPTIALTDKSFTAYRGAKSLEQKEAFEAVLNAARAEGAVSLQWDGMKPGEGFIRQVRLEDVERLSGFLGTPLQSSLIARATELFAEYVSEFPVLAEVLARWRSLKSVRGFGPEDAGDFVDAARVLRFLRQCSTEREDVRLRVASMEVFGQSKRLERLSRQVDIVRSASLAADAVGPQQMWAELGLVKDPQPALLAGQVKIQRERVCSFPDVPYVGLAPASVLAIVSDATSLLTVENLMNFHAEALRVRDRPVLVVYTAGMPSPSWRAMYRRLLSTLPATATVAHWGDLDEGGLRIAAMLASDAISTGRSLLPHRMHPTDVPQAYRVTTKPEVVDRMARWAERAGWSDLALAIAEHKIKFEQEGLEADSPSCSSR